MMIYTNSKFLLIGVIFLFECLVISNANLQKNGCPKLESLQNHCLCETINPSNTSTTNLKFSCSGKKLGDITLHGLFRRLEESYSTPDEEDHQTRTEADDSEEVLDLGSNKPKFSNLNITASSLKTLDFKLLEQVHFESINIVNNPNLRQIIRAEHFKDDGGKFTYDKLVPVDVINNFTRKITIEGSPNLGKGKSERDLFDQLSRLKALKHLTLANNGLKFVPDRAFGRRAESKNLRTIDLKENRIREIGQRAFAGLHSLNRINLDGNDLVRLYDSSFAADETNSEIIMIFLRYNRLTENSFEDGAFDGLGNRHVFIYLSNNFLTSLPESVFGSLLRRKSQRTFITMFENPLNCEDCSLQWLFKGRERFSQKVYGAVCQHTGQSIFKLPANFYDEMCGAN